VQNGRKSWRTLTLVVVLVLFATALAGDSAHSGAGGFPSESVTQFGAALSTNVTCGLLGPDPGTSAGLPQYVANVTAIWDKLCIQPAFVAVIAEWGDLLPTYTGGANNTTYLTAGNLTSGFYVKDTILPVVTFAVFWSAACENGTVVLSGTQCGYQDLWTGNVSTNKVFGPSLTEYDCQGCSLSGPPPPTFPAGSEGALSWLALALVAPLGVVIWVVLAMRFGVGSDHSTLSRLPGSGPIPQDRDRHR